MKLKATFFLILLLQNPVFAIDNPVSVCKHNPKRTRECSVSSNNKPNLGCKNNPGLVAPCFTIHGRLEWKYPGPPGIHIWHVGTKRVLGVAEGFPLPQSVNNEFDMKSYVYGDFELCPFSQQLTGVMQIVCVESAGKIKAYPKDR